MGSPYKALTNDFSREILTILVDEELSVGENTEQFKISKSAISNHMEILIEADLVKEEKMCGWVFTFDILQPKILVFGP